MRVRVTLHSQIGCGPFDCPAFGLAECEFMLSVSNCVWKDPNGQMNSTHHCESAFFSMPFWSWAPATVLGPEAHCLSRLMALWPLVYVQAPFLWCGRQCHSISGGVAIYPLWFCGIFYLVMKWGRRVPLSTSGFRIGTVTEGQFKPP
jgi:hypothetical protein